MPSTQFRVAALVVASVLAVFSVGSASAQSSVRAVIADGDVYELTDNDFGGYVEIMLSWSKRADFDIVVEAVGPDGSVFDVCIGLSTQEAFERCAFGQGNTAIVAGVPSMTGAPRRRSSV